MLRLLADNWWILAVRGVLAVLFGVGALAWPGLSLAVLIALFAGWALADGVFCLVKMFRASGLGLPWWPFLLQGVVSLAAGLAALAYPGLTAVVLLYLIAARALVVGVLEVFVGICLRREIEQEWRLILNGALSIVVGLALFANPGAGALAVVWLVGLSAIVLGAILIWAALGLRDLGKQLADRRTHPA